MESGARTGDQLEVIDHTLMLVSASLGLSMQAWDFQRKPGIVCASLGLSAQAWDCQCKPGIVTLQLELLSNVQARGLSTANRLRSMMEITCM